MNTMTLVSTVGIFLAGALVGQFVGRNLPSGTISTLKLGPPVSQTLIRVTDCSPTSTDGPSTPQDTFALALAQADGEWKSAQLSAAFTRLLAHSPAEALRDVDRIPIDYRQQVVGAALAQVAAQQPDRVLGYIDGITENYASYLGVVLGVIAQRDPARAVDIAIQNADRDPTGAMFGSLIPVLVQSNLERAASLVSAMNKPQVTVIQQVASEYARNDPDRAYQWASEVARRHGPNLAEEAVDALSVSLATSSPEVALNFLARTQDVTIRNSLIRAISQHMGQQDLRSAWAWLSDYRTDASYSENARNLLYRWSYAKPEEVAELLPSIDDREIRSAVADELAIAWQKRDPNAYQAWLGSLTAGAPR
jgi:hypothetical protein